MDDQPPIQGPMFRIECPGMHFDHNDPHVWVADSRDRDSLTEFCIS